MRPSRLVPIVVLSAMAGALATVITVLGNKLAMQGAGYLPEEPAQAEGENAPLGWVAPDLVRSIGNATADAQRQVAASVARWIVDRVPSSHPEVTAGLAALGDGQYGETPQRRALFRLFDALAAEPASDLDGGVDELPELTVQESILLSATPERADEYVVRTLWAALDSDPLWAALAAPWEAMHVEGDVEAVRLLVESELIGGAVHPGN